MASRGYKNKRDTERSPFSRLSDDLLVEIFSRVPFKSTCCCKCVSTQWRDVVSHPDHRKKLPRSTLAGFFYNEDRDDRPAYRHYQSVSGNWRPCIDPSLSFLPTGKKTGVDMLDSCNGLLLCRRWKQKLTGRKIVDYVVCNPATEKWVAVPPTKRSNVVWGCHLGFDPAVSSHFHVFEVLHVCYWHTHKKGDISSITGVGIYSSKAGAWTHQSAWDPPIYTYNIIDSAFLSGVMYLSLINPMVVAVIDVEGNCRTIPVPTPHKKDASFYVYISRGQVHLANDGASELLVWVLEDSSREIWTLKYNISHFQLLGKEYSSFDLDYEVLIHPEHNEIFLVCYEFSSGRTTLMSYKMDSRELHFLCDSGRYCLGPYLQYVPLFSESLADGD